ncbi:DUF58 domain-containing protein [Mycobacterium sp. M23085]|uniref:DUF58 domain-containing protein n=1 Tax=Mycobacterium sp. M23085 TaxID=3378087 RepID=UPI0038780114
MVLTGRTGLVALICVLPIALSPWPATTFVVLLLALALAVMLDVGLAASTTQLRYVRSPDRSARLGQQVECGLSIHNDGARRFRGQLRDAWPPSAQAQPRTHPVDIPAGQDQHVQSRLQPVRRGDQRATVVTARSIGPLGLAGRQGSRPVPGQLRVLPPFLARKHLPSRLAKLREIDGLLPTLVRGQGTEFDSLREYVVGDDVRSIDWRATARRADVVVRTWRPERDRRVLIVLDTGRTAAGRVGVDPAAADCPPPPHPAARAASSAGASDPAGWPRLDWSMDAALLLAALASRAGDHVDFLAHDQVSRAGVFGASRTELLAQLVDAMAPLQPTLVESDWRATASAIARRARQRSLVVLLTDLNAAALDEGLLPVLPQLSAKHHLLLAAVSDPRVDQMAAGRSDAAAVYDAAAAERSRNERGAIANRLRRSGVEVVDAPPAELAPALADHYLAMKATGRL